MLGNHTLCVFYDRQLDLSVIWKIRCGGWDDEENVQ